MFERKKSTIIIHLGEYFYTVQNNFDIRMTQQYHLSSGRESSRNFASALLSWHLKETMLPPSDGQNQLGTISLEAQCQHGEVKI